jgi:hypothetical protein
MVPRTLPATTALATLVTLHENKCYPMLVYMAERHSSFAFKARRDEDILKLCYTDYFP